MIFDYIFVKKYNNCLKNNSALNLFLLNFEFDK